MVHLFKNVGERSAAKNYQQVLLGLSTSLELLELYHLIHPRLLTRFDMLVFFTSLMEFQVRYLALFCLSLVIDSFKSLWTGSLHDNI